MLAVIAVRMALVCLVHGKRRPRGAPSPFPLRPSTKLRLLDQVALGGRYPLLVGDGAQIARKLEC